MNFQTTIMVNGQPVNTLADILPDCGPMKLLIIAKTPAPISVARGHYFQGKQGQMFWNRLRADALLRVSNYDYPDEVLLAHGYGITDIVKTPHEYDMEPTEAEYRAGLDRILDLIANLQPRVAMFVYKRVLDRILNLAFGVTRKAVYGFNSEYDELFKCKVFAFPMPGTPCTKAEALIAMASLKAELES